MSRIDLDPANLAELLRGADRDLRELKTRQFAGASDLQILVTAAPVHVYNGALPGGSTIDFTADTMPNAFVELFWTVGLDSAANIIHPGDTYYPFIDKLQFPKSLTGVPTDASVVPGVTRFVTHFNGYSGHNYYVTYYVQATDTGSFVIT